MNRLAVDYRHFTGGRVQGEFDGRFFGPNLAAYRLYSDRSNPIHIAEHNAFFYVGLFLIR